MASAPPCGTPRQCERKSPLQVALMAAICCGVGPDGAGAATGGAATGAAAGRLTGSARVARGGGAVMTARLGAAGAGAAVAAGGGVAAGAACGGGADAGSVAATAFRQSGDNPATFVCKHFIASAPPGDTPEHFDMKSERQLAFMAFCWAPVTCGCAGAATGLAWAVGAAAGAGLAWGGGAGGGRVDATAFRQSGDSVATFVCRHFIASAPPGLTPEHFDMKSERQLALMALCWALEICACAAAVRAASASAAIPDKTAARACLLIGCMASPCLDSDLQRAHGTR